MKIAFAAILLAGVGGTIAACGDSSTGGSTFGSPGTTTDASGGMGGSASVCVDRDKDGVPEYCSPGPQPAQVDCDGSNPAIYPGATEVCDLVDNDCNGLVDDGDGAPECNNACRKTAGKCDPAVELTANDSSVCYRTESGKVFCFGANSDAALGSNETAWAYSPLEVPGVSGAKALLGTRFSQTCAVLEKEAICWGDGLTIPRHQAIPADGTAYALSSKGLCALTDAGAIECVDQPDEKETLLDSGAIAIDGNAAVLCAVLTTGAIHCWGYSHSSVAIDQELVASGATSVKVGPDSVCAVVGGELACWAEVTDKYRNQASVPGNGSAVALGLSEEFKCALSAAGKVACWSGYSPTALPSAKSIAAGKGFACAIVSDGRVMCWGNVDKSGIPVLTEPNTATAAQIPYSVPSDALEPSLLLAEPPLGACDNAADLFTIGLDDVFYSMRSCAEDCQDSLDAKACFGPCYQKAHQYFPISNACTNCFQQYFACESGDCLAALDSCVGFPVYSAVYRWPAPDTKPTCPGCAAKKHTGEACKSDSECRVGKCGQVPTPLASTTLNTVCRLDTRTQ